MKRTDALARRWATRPRGNPGRAQAELVCGGGAALLLTGLFIALTGCVMSGRCLAFDRAVFLAVRGHASPRLTAAVRFVPDIGTATAILVPLLALWLLAQRRVGAAIFALASEAGAFALYSLLKGAIGRVRSGEPTPPATVWDYLFPSGHTLGTLITFGLLAYFVGGRLRGWRRGAVVTAAAGVVAAESVSLVYLDTHYATDVLGGLLIGGAWLLLSMVGLRLIEAALGTAAARPPRACRPSRPHPD